MSLVLAVLPAGLTASFLEGRAGESAPGICQGRCQCCMERNSVPSRTHSVPVQAPSNVSNDQTAVEKSSAVIALLPPAAKAITPALSERPLSSAEIPLFERYCVFLI